jgi:hypothetical protein
MRFENLDNEQLISQPLPFAITTCHFIQFLHQCSIFVGLAGDGVLKITLTVKSFKYSNVVVSANQLSCCVEKLRSSLFNFYGGVDNITSRNNKLCGGVR